MERDSNSVVHHSANNHYIRADLVEDTIQLLIEFYDSFVLRSRSIRGR